MHATLNRFDPGVEARLDAMLAGSPGLAVFDADHTLYCEDAGEAFYRELFGDARFAEYRALEARNSFAAYAKIATDMAGMEEVHLQERASAFFREHFAPRVYPAMRRLIDRLGEAGWRVHVVTASPRWIIQAGAPLFGLAAEQVIGVDVALEAGRLTDRLAYALPYGPGKVHAIERFLGARPRFAAGDSAADRFMLETATHGALALAYDDYPAQQPLLDRARERGWMIQRCSK